MAVDVENGVGLLKSGIKGEAERLPVDDERFGVVISSDVIDLIPDTDTVFAVLVLVLAPGGRLQIADAPTQNLVTDEGLTSIRDPQRGRPAFELGLASH